MGSTDLHQLLKTLCSNSVWNYAVFWKLKHRARMVLTWEDAYYENSEQHNLSENKCFSETPENLHGGHYSHDPLGLAVAKMSYHVYSLGEGIVGQVAVTQKHQWIFADATNSCSSFESCDGWGSQFSAGIKTIVVVAVVPHGVVELGSLNKVTEDMKLVTHIRDAFFALQDLSVGHFTSPIQCSTMTPLCLPDLPTASLVSEVIPGCLSDIDKAMETEGANVWLPLFPYIKKHNIFPLPFGDPNGAVNVVNKQNDLEISASGSGEGTKILQSEVDIINWDHQNQVGMCMMNDGTCQGDTSGQKDLDMGSEHNSSLHSKDSDMTSTNLYSVALQSEKFGINHLYAPSRLLESALSGGVKLEARDSSQNGELHSCESSDINLQKELENPTKLSHLDSSITTLKFWAGCELHEALGPAFMKKSIYSDWEAEKIEAAANIGMTDGATSSQVTFDPGSENLLEAIVANVCHSSSDVKSERSFCKSMQSLLTTEKMPEPSSQTEHTINSAGYSLNQPLLVEENRQHCSNSSDVCGAVSSKGFSSNCVSICSEQLERSSEPAKNSKKRARPGENSRPRPRDRQLIQDRIKELRELVPNGSKCSIDSLLERTIKHMLFLQSITKHADKLSKCAESKIHQKRTGLLGSSNYEQGSSWAVEVGGHLKVCSIVVENLNKNGQMLVEMLCEECSHFLEIAEAIRSLGLTILKGITEAHGEKMWICFVVEGQNNRVMHRMDILWSLVQILQPKSTS